MRIDVEVVCEGRADGSAITRQRDAPAVASALLCWLGKMVIVRTSFAKADEPSANAWLGQHAAISGDTIAVTYANERSAASGVNGQSARSLTSSGAVYVFR